MFFVPQALLSTTNRYIRERWLNNTVGPVSPTIFNNILDDYEDNVIFVHVGLSDIETAFETNPYNFLYNSLLNHFESILCPGFTPSFRKSGKYHLHESVPEVGKFSQLFFEDADYRTEDAIHSILVKGNYRFDHCNHQHTFGEDGCFAQLDRDNVLIVNIGTPGLISTQFHYIEMNIGVPYAKIEDSAGEIIYSEEDKQQITQRNYTYGKYKPLCYRNIRKVRKELITSGKLDYYNLNGLSIMICRAGTMYNHLKPLIESDPYYLIR